VTRSKGRRYALMLALAVAQALAGALPLRAQNAPPPPQSAPLPQPTAPPQQPAPPPQQSAPPQQNSAPPQQGAAPQISFTLPDQTANLPAGQENGQATLLMRIEGANLPATPPRVEDQRYPATYSIEPPQLFAMSREPGAQNWLIVLNVRGFRPQLGAARYLTVSHGSHSAMLQYSVDNAYGSPFQWKVFAPAATGMNWRSGMAVPISVVIGGPVPATGVSLAQSVLIEEESRAALELELCSNAEGDCVRPGVLAAQRIHNLFLRQRGADSVTPGNYTGSIVVAATENPGGEALTLSLFATTDRLRALGLLAIVAGVGLSWLLTVVARNTLARKELERPLALLEGRRSELQAILAAAFPADRAASVPATIEAFRRTETELGRARALLPPAVPTPWQGQWADRSAFEALVAQIDSRMNGLDVVVREGLVPVAALPSTDPGQAEAVARIDAEAATAGSKPLEETKVAVLAALAAAQGQEFDSSAVQPPALERLNFEIALLSGASWLVILILTVLAGAVAVVLSDKGFGQWQDFATCLLWGFGIPIAGGQLNTIGAEQVRSAVSVARPA